METIYGLVILGAEPAGFAVGPYGGRYRLNTLLVGGGQDGGQIVITSDAESCPGQMVEAGESGATLIARMTKQVDKFGVHRVSTSVEKVGLEGPVRRLMDTKGNVYEGKTVIIATGTHPRPIGCKDEKEFLGRSTSFCATCDVSFYEDMEVYVVGGGDFAIEEAIYLIRLARKVTVTYRRGQSRAAQSVREKAFRNEKLHFMQDSVVDGVRGGGILDTMVVRSVKTGELAQMDVNPDGGMFGLFGFIGYLPNTGLLEGTDLTMEGEYIRADEDMRTNLSGVYMADDVRTKSLRQTVTAAVDGAIVACQVEHYVADLQ